MNISRSQSRTIPVLVIALLVGIPIGIAAIEHGVIAALSISTIALAVAIWLSKLRR